MEDNYLSCKEFEDKFEIDNNFLTYNGCIQAIKSYVHRTGIVIDRDQSNDSAKMHWILYVQYIKVLGFIMIL